MYGGSCSVNDMYGQIRGVVQFAIHAEARWWQSAIENFHLNNMHVDRPSTMAHPIMINTHPYHLGYSNTPFNICSKMYGGSFRVNNLINNSEMINFSLFRKVFNFCNISTEILLKR